jgi:hypothetical protein
LALSRGPLEHVLNAKCLFFIAVALAVVDRVVDRAVDFNDDIVLLLP